MRRLLTILCVVMLAHGQGLTLRDVSFVASRQVVAASGSEAEAFSSRAGFALLSNFTGEVGFKFVASANFTITQLGRWVVSGNSQTHTLRVRNGAGTLLASVVVDTSGAPVDAWLYGTLASPLAIANGTTYYILSTETNGGDQWYNDAANSVTRTAAFDAVHTSQESGYYDGSVHPGSANLAYGPTNMKFTNP